jgi:hypothetical protein
MSESLPPEAGSLHGEIPDTPENREFFKELLKEDTHDPLCPLVATTCGVPPADHDWGWVSDRCWCFYCGQECHCSTIAVVRADQRKIDEKYYLNSCMRCGFDDFSIHMCDECLKELEEDD